MDALFLHCTFVHIPLLSLSFLLPPKLVGNFKTLKFSMSLVEESTDIERVENDERHVDANFANDGEYEPNKSYPNLNTNK